MVDSNGVFPVKEALRPGYAYQDLACYTSGHKPAPLAHGPNPSSPGRLVLHESNL